MSGTMHGRANAASVTAKPSLRTRLFEIACDVATEAEVDAAIEAALAPYDGDSEPPMIGFRASMDDVPKDDDCPICRELDEMYGAPELVPLPDGTVLEIRRHREVATPR